MLSLISKRIVWAFAALLIAVPASAQSAAQTITTSDPATVNTYAQVLTYFHVAGGNSGVYNWTGAIPYVEGLATKSWDTPGTYTVSVQDPGTNYWLPSNTVTFTVNVQQPQAQTITTSTPLTVNTYAGAWCSFSASGASTNTYTWTGANANWDGSAANKTWDTPGTYTVTVQSPPYLGYFAASNIITFTVNVQPPQNQPITANGATTIDTYAGTRCNFSASGSVTGTYNWTGATANWDGNAYQTWYKVGTYTVAVQAPAYGGYYAPSNTIDFKVNVVPSTTTGYPGAANQAKQGNKPQNSAGDPIQIATGSEAYSHHLFTFGGARPWELEIAYNSVLSATQAQPGAFGYGWTNQFEAYLTQANGNVVVHHDATHYNTYTPASGSSTDFRCTDAAVATDKLTANADGSWTLTHKDQSKQIFDATGRLITDSDPRGRILSLGYTTAGKLASITEPVSGTQLTFAYNAQGLVQSLTDAAGETVSFEYDSVPMLTKIVNQNSKPFALIYDAERNIQSLSDDPGAVLTTNTYDSFGRAIAQTDGVAGHGTLNLNYYQPWVGGNIQTTVTDKTGATTTYTFDANYNLLSTQDPQGHTTSHTYDVAGNKLTDTDPLGNTTTYSYDAASNLVSITDPAGKQKLFTYDANNNLHTVTDALGHTTTRTYDSKNNLLSITDADGNTTSWTYDANSLPLTKTQPGGGVTHYEYTNGLLTKVTDPNGVVTKSGYNANGRLAYQEDALGNRTTFAYDNAGYLLSETNALNQTTSYTYNNRNRRATKTDASGAVTTYGYDAADNLISVTDALGHTTTTTYDSEDRVLTVVDPLGHTRAKTYSVTGNVATETDPTGAVTTYGYDTAGRLVSTTDALGNQTSVSYDSRNLTHSVTDPLNRTTVFGYDDAGRGTSTTDAAGKVTTTAYDCLNRVAGIMDPGSLTTTQTYSVDGVRNSFTNARGKTTTISTDLGGRVTAITTPGGKTSSITYDERGLPHTATTPSGHVATTNYDAAGRISSIVDGVGTISFSRDANGRQLTATESGKTLTRTYDLLGHVTSFTDHAGNTIGYTYDAAGNLITLTYPDGKVVTYAYDAANRLIKVTDWSNRVTTYTYDACGRLLTTVRPNGTVQERIYNAADEQTDHIELAADGTTYLFGSHQTFDLRGRISKDQITPKKTLPAVESTVQTFDDDNRLLSHNGQATAFDLDGNLLTLPGFTSSSFVYDTRNRLTSANGLSYGYDAEGHRVSVTSASGTTTFMVNPENRLSQVLVKTNPDGTVTRYVYGLGLAYEETGTSVSYYHFDRRGDTIAMTDASGTVVGRACYGIYGELLSINGLNTPFLFNGLYGVQTDSNGLYYHRARYYSAALRRFINQDVTLGDVETASSLNRFAYANADPVSGIDPLGLECEKPKPRTYEDIRREVTPKAHRGETIPMTDSDLNIVMEHDAQKALLDFQSWKNFGQLGVAQGDSTFALWFDTQFQLKGALYNANEINYYKVGMGFEIYNLYPWARGSLFWLWNDNAVFLLFHGSFNSRDKKQLIDAARWMEIGYEFMKTNH